jgi:hypothetical protein
MSVNENYFPENYFPCLIIPMCNFSRQLQKMLNGNRAGILEEPCSGTFWSWLHGFPAETRNSPKVRSCVTLNLPTIRNCKALEVSLPGFRNAISGFILSIIA